MPEAQTYSDFFRWLITRKASSTSEVRDWYTEYSSFVNEIDADVKRNRVNAVFQSNVANEALAETDSNSIIFNGTLAAQTYFLPAIDADNVGMLFRVISDNSANTITMSRSGSTDTITVNGVAHGTTYDVVGSAIYIVAKDASTWDVQSELPAHSMGGASHTADTLANLNTKISDATLDDSGDTRPTVPDGTTITGAGTSGSPLVATGDRSRTAVSTATYTALSTDQTLDVQYDGPVTITLPDSELTNDGRMFSISDRWRESASANNITVVNESGDVIAIINASGSEIDVISNTTEWS